MCHYAVRLTLRPGTVSQSDIEELHSAGFNDEQITVAVQVIGYFNYINRIADGLGVDPEDWMKSPGRKEWQQRKFRFSEFGP